MKAGYNLFEPQKCRTCWVCYLDILGFKERVTRSIGDGVIHYYQSREIVECWLRRKPRLRLACWSDSYVIYSEDDSAGSFWDVEQVARHIDTQHMMRHIPIRGALSCGAMYIVEEDGICIGPPLVEAYEHAENQNWIGFLLCRSATRRLTELKLPPSRRLNYRRCRIPWKGKKRGVKPLYAFSIGASTPISGKNVCLDALSRMALEAKTAKVREKYRKTIEFLSDCGVLQVLPKTGP
jgi:hypothetical protein